MNSRLPEFVIGFLASTAIFVAIGSIKEDFLHDLKAPEVVNFALVLVTVALWWATKNLVRGAELTSERQLRAYLAVSQHKLDAERGTLSITIQNRGQTPARDVVGHINWYWLPFGHSLPADFSYPDFNVPELVSNPTAWPNEPLHWNFAIDMEKIQQAAKSELSLYFYGHFSYVDAFEKERQTNFCYTVIPGELPKGKGLLTVSKHNSYT